MKGLTFLLLIAVAVAISCSKEDAKPDYSKYKALIKPVSKSGTLKALTNEQVVKQAWELSMNNNGMSAVATRDTINNMLIIPADAIITMEGWLRMDDFLFTNDITIRDRNSKIIAYITNAEVKKGRELIINAFNADRKDSCVWYLQNCYHFIPINDADWRELYRQGKN
jgi:hypothetical protein